jgi:hypothetical protein
MVRGRRAAAATQQMHRVDGRDGDCVRASYLARRREAVAQPCAPLVSLLEQHAHASHASLRARLLAEVSAAWTGARLGARAVGMLEAAWHGQAAAFTDAPTRRTRFAILGRPLSADEAHAADRVGDAVSPVAAAAARELVDGAAVPWRMLDAAGLAHAFPLLAAMCLRHVDWHAHCGGGSPSVSEYVATLEERWPAVSAEMSAKQRAAAQAWLHWWEDDACVASDPLRALRAMLDVAH